MASSSSTSSTAASASAASSAPAVAAASSSVNPIEQLNGQTIYLPTGYRFGPSDKTIVIHYLKNEIRNQPLPVDIIPRTNLYSFGAPEKIPHSKHLYEFFFFFKNIEKYYSFFFILLNIAIDFEVFLQSFFLFWQNL